MLPAGPHEPYRYVFGRTTAQGVQYKGYAAHVWEADP